MDRHQRYEAASHGDSDTTRPRWQTRGSVDTELEYSGYMADPQHDRSVPRGGASRRFPRIAKPVELIQHSYDCVIIGSGYGGSVAASRIARTGQSVCVLEKGRERWPGEYPIDFREVASEIHVSGDVAPGSTKWGSIDNEKHTGLYQLTLGQGQSVLSCAGLGGGSLINANVFLKAEPDVLSLHYWPKEIRDNPECLSEYYGKARDMLQPEPIPDHWPDPPKMRLLQKEAEVLGLASKHYRTTQTTRFTTGPNSTGVHMSASTLSGQDVTGVNDGSKTTNLVTYLADAWNWGAEMFCECEARYIEKADEERGGYIVYFAWHGHKRSSFKNLRSDPMWVHAKSAVFFGGGAMGTTEILLRSKAHGLRMSDHIGQNMSGNGNVLAFGYNMNCETHTVGSNEPPSERPVGTTITSAIDCRQGHKNPLSGFVIQDAAVSQGLAPLVHALLSFVPDYNTANRSVLKRASMCFAWWKSTLFGFFTGSGPLSRIQPLISISHDGCQATLSLVDDRPSMEFLGAGKGDRIREINDLLAEGVAKAHGGSMLTNSFYGVMDEQLLTVHPLGGAAMASDGTGATGVVNHIGQVFTGCDTSDTHPGLIVVDGAAVPTSLGMNPLATIAALAERTVASYIRANSLISSQDKNGLIDLFGLPAKSPERRQALASSGGPNGFVGEDLSASALEVDTDIGFTELLIGYIHCGAHERAYGAPAYETAYRLGKSRGELARLFVTIAATKRERDDGPGYGGRATGTFVCPALKGSPFMVLGGDFDAFVRDGTEAGTTRFFYDFDIVGIDGRRLHFHGHKTVSPRVTLNPWQFWRATSTLFVSITEPAPTSASAASTSATADRGRASKSIHGRADGNAGTCACSRDSTLVAQGIVSLHMKDLLKQVFSITPKGNFFLERVSNLSSFLGYFCRKSLSQVLAPLTPLQYPLMSPVDCMNHTPPQGIVSVVASDGVLTELYIWEPRPGSIALNETGQPVRIHDILLIPGAALGHQIFSLATVPVNAVNYLTRAGYRVFVLLHRLCRIRSSRGPWTTFDARFDIRAGLEVIRARQGPRGIYTVAHCLGSVACASGLLDGTIPADWIAGMTCAQVFMHPLWQTINQWKASSPVPLDKLFGRLLGQYYEFATSEHDGLVQNLLDQLLRFYPQERHEMCNNAVCLRASLIFGRCFSHANINEATHAQIDKLFGGVSMTLMNFLVRGRPGFVTTNPPSYEPLATPENIERLRGIPFLFLSSMDSAVLSPISTEKSYEVLRNTFGISAGRPDGGIQYRRHKLEGYGHLDSWLGQHAWRDVFPIVQREVDRVVRGEDYIFRGPNDEFAAIMASATLSG